MYIQEYNFFFLHQDLDLSVTKSTEILTLIYFYFSGFAYIGIARLFNFYPFGQKQQQQSSQIQTIQISSEEKWKYQEK